MAVNGKTNKKANRKAMDTVDFFDAAQGIACWEQSKLVERERSVAFVKIRIFIRYGDSFAIDRLREFIKTLFKAGDVHEEQTGASMANYKVVTFTVYTQCASVKDDAEKWLANCTLLNTYRDFLMETTGISKMKILFGVYGYDSQKAMAKAIPAEILSNQNYNFSENLAINEVVYAATTAKEELPARSLIIVPNVSGMANPCKWYAYNLVYAELSENLKRQIGADA